MAYDLTLDGAVVGELQLNDNDKLLTIITSKRGKMVVLAKGIKSIKSKKSAGGELFCYSTFGFVKREERLFLQSVELKENFQGIRENIESVALASYFAEVASSICMEDNNENEMLRLLLNSFYALSNFKNTPLWAIKAAFEIKSMCIQGFSPNFDSCVVCGKTITPSSRNIAFEPLQGGFVCSDCSSKEDFELSKDGYLISRNTYDVIKYISNAQQSKMLAFNLDKKYIREFSDVCEQYITVHTEKKFKTLEYYNKLIKG